MKTLENRLQEAVDDCGLATEQWLRRLDVSRGTFNNYISGRRKPTFEFLAEFSNVSGVSLDYLIKGSGTEFAEKKSIRPNDADFVRIDILDVDLAAGAGRIAPNEEAIGQLAFRVDWLNRIGVNPAEASLVRVEGESMEPTLPGGSMVMIDHRNKEPIAKRGVFACRKGDLLMVKRVEVSLEDLSVMLHSDNPTVPTKHIQNPAEADFEIIGKVVWSAKTWAD